VNTDRVESFADDPADRIARVERTVRVPRDPLQPCTAGAPPLHGLGQPDREDLLLNGLLPELRRRDLLDIDHMGGDFRANLELPALRREAVAA